VALVLLIDDNLTQLRIREAVLREAGFAVSSASTAEQALTSLRSFAPGPDAIVTDHILPGASGSAFVRQLREICPRVPVIVISGMIEAEGEYEGLRVIFLRKPCPPECLIREVQSALEP
jgi:CheY-like chemotaxis protein